MCNQLVFDLKGKPKKLGDQVGKPGGEGTVYDLLDMPDSVVKIYHERKLEKYSKLYSEKIEAMRSMRNEFSKLKQVCWPRISVYDQYGNWIGYAMNKGHGIPMIKLAHAMACKNNFPNLDRIQLVQLLINFTEIVRKLHSKNVFIGDYNLGNFLCDQQSKSITLIDCDSYQIRIGKKNFPCPVGSPDLTPFEHQGKDFIHVIRNEKSESFSSAIIFFKCLMLGRHPYDQCEGDDCITNLKKSYFPYGIGAKGIPKGPWYNIWSHMPHRIKELFIKTFREGVKDPTKRPSLDDWSQGLRFYLSDLNKGYLNAEMNPGSPKSNEYRGKKLI